MSLSFLGYASNRLVVACLLSKSSNSVHVQFKKNDITTLTNSDFTSKSVEFKVKIE